jgi:hypothetical protein
MGFLAGDRVIPPSIGCRDLRQVHMGYVQFMETTQIKYQSKWHIGLHTHTEGLGQSRKMAPVYCENHSEHFIVCCSQNADILLFNLAVHTGFKGLSFFSATEMGTYI